MFVLKVKWAVRPRRGNSTSQENRTFWIGKHPMAKVTAIQEKGWTCTNAPSLWTCMLLYIVTDVAQPFKSLTIPIRAQSKHISCNFFFKLILWLSLEVPTILFV